MLIIKKRNKKLCQNVATTSCYTILITTMIFIQPAYADWFQVANVKTELITPIYNLINDNLGLLAFAAGAVATLLARGQDLWQKAVAFGTGSLGFAGAVKIAKLMLDV